MKPIQKQKKKWGTGKRSAKQPYLSESGPPIIIREKIEGICIYVDGACQPNPGRGGYAFVVIEDEEVLHEYNRRVEDTTNNRMEMSAIIDALQWVLVECPGEKVTILTDSEYCHKGVTKWHCGWEKNDYVGVKNSELWQEMITLKKQCENVSYKWVRGHNGNKWNEYVDKLAVAAVTGKREEDTWKPFISREAGAKLRSEGLKGITEADALLLAVYKELYDSQVYNNPVIEKVKEYLMKKQIT